MDRKLSDIDVLWIRAACILNHKAYGSKALADLFCVSRTTIERIVNRETYRHLRPRTLPPLPQDYCVNVPVMIGEMRQWFGDEVAGERLYLWREAAPGETPERFVHAVEEAADPRIQPSLVRKFEFVAKAWEPDGNLTAVEYEQEARWRRRDIATYAASYRKRNSLELAKKRRPRRTKRQMDWARKFAPDTV